MQSKPIREPDHSCPKRTWILLTLSDDELIGVGDALPRGLAFHLSRCSECRELAEELSAVTSSLRTASEHDPTDELFHAAQAQAIAALENGARLTGRVEIVDDWIDTTGRDRSLGLGTYARFAAAAAVIVTLGLLGYFGRSTEDRPGHVALVADGHADDTGSVAPHVADQQKSSIASNSTNEPTQDDEEVRVAEGTAAYTPYPIRRHRSVVEAAFSDDPHGAQAAYVIPGLRDRDLGWFRVFDKPAAVLSTKAPEKER